MEIACYENRSGGPRSVDDDDSFFNTLAIAIAVTPDIAAHQLKSGFGEVGRGS
jgi:hypothetical protein